MHLIKTAQNRPHTAAIGDGGNDVSMIQEAHVGIGILGREGRQASMSADFAFTKFMYLKKALLVHGHWYYQRISILTQYFFYKNFVFITPQVLYCLHNGFSTQVRIIFYKKKKNPNSTELFKESPEYVLRTSLEDLVLSRRCMFISLI